jgi:hypothetical protein
MAKDFWPIRKARKDPMYWTYMIFSQRGGRAKRPAKRRVYFASSPKYFIHIAREAGGAARQTTVPHGQPEMVACAFSAAVPGPTTRGICVRPRATGTPRTTVTGTAAFGWRVRPQLEPQGSWSLRAKQKIGCRIQSWVAQASHTNSWRLRRAIFKRAWFDPATPRSPRPPPRAPAKDRKPIAG